MGLWHTNGKRVNPAFKCNPQLFLKVPRSLGIYSQSWLLEGERARRASFPATLRRRQNAAPWVVECSSPPPRPNGGEMEEKRGLWWRWEAQWCLVEVFYGGFRGVWRNREKCMPI